jgi:Fe-S-cluster-containing hydrogenase component 2
MKTDNNYKACSGCRICLIACSLEKEKRIMPREARLLVIGTNKDQFHRPNICRHCDNAPCAESCPTDAIELRSDGLLTFHADRCTKCGECIDACSFDVLKLSGKNGLPLVCDGCNGRFPCIERCPTGAIFRLERLSVPG